jgi:hypothetical protein
MGYRLTAMVWFPVEKTDFTLLHREQTGSGVHLVFYPVVTRDLPSGVKRPRREAGHSFPSRSEVKNTPPYVFMAWCLITSTGTTSPHLTLPYLTLPYHVITEKLHLLQKFEYSSMNEWINECVSVDHSNLALALRPSLIYSASHFN